MDAGQRKLIEKVRAEGRLVIWPDQPRLAALLPAYVKVEGTDQVLVVLRARPDDATAPLAIHLLNRGYDQEKDAMTPLTGFRLRLRQDLLGTRKPGGAVLHRPRGPSIPLEVHADGDHTVVNIPGLDLWAIVEL